MNKHLFIIDNKHTYHLKQDNSAYFILSYTEEYCEMTSSWKVNCVLEDDYWETQLNGIPFQSIILRERDFIEYDQMYLFNPPPRKPSLKTLYVKDQIETILKAPQEISKKLGNKYNLYSGLIKEQLIRDLISNLLESDLTGNVKVGTGFIINNKKEKTKQIDIIIYKQIFDGFSFYSGNFVITKPENVFATIEIKSKLDGVDINEALDNQYSVAKVANKANPNIARCIIGFEKKFKKIESFQKWISDFYKIKFKNDKNIIKNFPTLMSTLDGFVVHFGQYLDTPHFFQSTSNEEISGFQMFYLTLLGILNEEGISIPNMNDYLNMLPEEEYRNDNPLGIEKKGYEIIIN